MTADAPTFYGHPMLWRKDRWYPAQNFRLYEIHITPNDAGDFQLRFDNEFYKFDTPQEAADFAVASCEESRAVLNQLSEGLPK